MPPKMRCADPRFDAHLHLVDRAVKLAASKRWPLDRDDARQAAMLGLFQACQRMPAGTEGFEYFAWYRVRGSVIDEARHSGMRRRVRPTDREDFSEAAGGDRALGLLPSAIFDEEGAIADWADTGPSPEDLAIARQKHDTARRAISRVDGRRAAILSRVLGGEKQREIAEDFGVTEPRISQLVADAIARVTGGQPNEGRVPRKSPITEEDLLWFLAAPGKKNARSMSERFGMSLVAAQGRINQLREKGLLNTGWGDYSPSPAGLARIGRRPAEQIATAAKQPAVAAASPAQAPAPEREPDRQTTPANVPSHVLGEDMRSLIERLSFGQDPLLAQANAQLRLRVTELEAEVAMLRARQQLTLERMAFAAEALTMGGAA